jgi:acetone carboxylase gamma subunit
MATKKKSSKPKTIQTKKLALYVGKTFVYRGHCGFDSGSFKRHYKVDLETAIPYGSTCLVVKEGSKRVSVLINGKIWNISKYYLCKEVEQLVNVDSPLSQLKNILSDTQSLLDHLHGNEAARQKLFLYQSTLRNVISNLEQE